MHRSFASWRCKRGNTSGIDVSVEILVKVREVFIMTPIARATCTLRFTTGSGGVIAGGSSSTAISMRTVRASPISRVIPSCCGWTASTGFRRCSALRYQRLPLASCIPGIVPRPNLSVYPSRPVRSSRPYTAHGTRGGTRARPRQSRFRTIRHRPRVAPGRRRYHCTQADRRDELLYLALQTL